MKTILIPVDFTDTSENAVNFAAEWSKAYQYQRIILLKTFYDTLFDHIVVSAEYGNVNQDFRLEERKNADLRLMQLSHLLSLKNKDIEVLTMTSELPLMRAILRAREQEQPEIIIIGSDTCDYDSDSYVAGHAIQIAKTSPVNVLVVPAGRHYQPLENVLIPVDAFALPSVDKVNSIDLASVSHAPSLKILYVDPRGVYSHGSERVSLSESRVDPFLGNFEHQIIYSGDKSVIDAILNFTSGSPVQLIVALPGQYSFLYRLTHKSILEAICRNTDIPVLILK